MSDRGIFIYVASYADRAEASTDYLALMDLHETRRLESYDVAMLVKDEAGKVHVEKHEKPTQHGAWGGILVGTLVGVLLPVVGVVAVAGAAAVGGLVGGLGGHLLEGMSRAEVNELGEILESGQAALIVIGESRAKEALDKALTRATRSIETVVDADHTQLRRELEEAKRGLGAEPE
jgi:uncharacterized membrane protein